MLLEEPTSSKFAYYICNLILLCIFLSCCEIILDSVVNKEEKNEEYKYYTYYFELILFVIFGTEYIMRLMASTAFGEFAAQYRCRLCRQLMSVVYSKMKAR